MTAPLLLSVIVFGLVVALVLGSFLYLQNVEQRRTLKARARGETYESISETADALASDIGSVFKNHLRAVIVRLGQISMPRSEEEIARINQHFIRAGYRNRRMVIIFFGAKVLCAAVLLVCFLSLRLFIIAHMGAVGLMVACMAAVSAGFFLPNMWLNLKVSGRRDMLTRGLPDALDLLVVCVEAGMGLDSAMKRVGEEMSLSNKALCDEFRLFNLELRAGKSRHDALKNLATRTGLDDIASLTTLLIQTERFGTSIGRALRVHSDSMRSKRAQRVEEVAAKLPIKMLFPTIFFIFPSLFVVLLGPALLRVFRLWVH